MAEFCKKCIKEIMGLEPNDEGYDAWLVKDGSVCEECGYAYLGLTRDGKKLSGDKQ